MYKIGNNVKIVILPTNKDQHTYIGVYLDTFKYCGLLIKTGV